MIAPATLTGTAGRAPAAVPAAEVVGLLALHGAVVFRGFGGDHERFVEMTRRYGDRFTCDPTKVRGGRWQTAPGTVGKAARAAARTADRVPRAGWLRRGDDGTRAAPFGGFGINPHNENAYIPDACPDLVWFLCRRAATDGGASILCDGTELLADLSDDAATFLRTTPFRYEVSLDEGQWHAAYGLDSEAELRALLDRRDDVSYELTSARVLEYVFDSIQIHPTRLGGAPAARTNLLSRQPFSGVARNQPERTSDGEPVPRWLVEDVLRAVSANQRDVELATGDLVLIDNSRVMHGRAPYTDVARRVITRCGWLDDDLAASVA